MKPIFVWQNKMLKKINPEKVICLCADGNYTRIIMADKTYYLVRASLSNVLKKLPPEIFIKVHRSLAASVYYIDGIYRDHLLVDGEPIPIGKQYYQSLIDKLNIIE